MSEWATTTRFETNWHQYWYTYGWNPEWLRRLYTSCTNKGNDFFWPSSASHLYDYERYYKERRARETRILPDGAASESNA